MKKLHQKTSVEVQSLLNETGHELTLDDIPSVLELDDLSHLVTGTRGAIAGMYRWPVKCGKLLLRPLTLGKRAWYNDRAREWFADDDETLITLLAFLLSYENSEDYINSLGDAQTAIDTINEWQKTVDCTVEELQAGVSDMINIGDDNGKADNKTSGDGPLIAMLCREYGSSPEYWIHKESINVIRALCDDYTRKMNAEIRKHNANIPKSGKGKGKATPPLKTPSMGAGLKFRQKIEELRERWTNDS